MKHFSYRQAIKSFAIALGLISTMLLPTGCHKTVESSTDLPTKFTELKINPAFQFDNFINLDVSIGISNPGTQMISVIQIYQGDPNVDGKLITSGATDANAEFKTSLRVPSRLKELWVGKMLYCDTEYAAS